MQADLAVDLDQPLLGQPDGLAVLGIPVVLERDDGVDAVVAAVELQDDQDATVLLWSGGVRRARQEAGQRRRKGDQGRIPQAAGEEVVVVCSTVSPPEECGSDPLRLGRRQQSNQGLPGRSQLHRGGP